MTTEFAVYDDSEDICDALRSLFFFFCLKSFNQNTEAENYWKPK
jgi:hypothetical protein